MADATTTALTSAEDEFSQFPHTLPFERSVEHIDDSGDLVLCAKSRRGTLKKFKVSSYTLARNSKPFKAMFSTKFSEGQAISERSTEQPMELELQQNSEALRHLCQLLHNRTPTVDEPGIFVPEGCQLSERALLDLAIIADEYDTVLAIQLPTKALFGDFVTLAEAGKNACLDLLTTAAFLLHQIDHFQYFTKQLILKKAKVTADNFDPESIELLHNYLVLSMFSQQSLARQELGTQVTALVAQYSRACGVADRKELVQELVTELERSNLLPPEPDFTLQFLLDQFENITIPTISTVDTIEKPKPRATQTCCNLTYPHSGWCLFGDDYVPMRAQSMRSQTSDNAKYERVSINAPTHKDIAKSIKKVKDICVGVCLDCIRNKPCRQGHRRCGKEGWDVPGTVVEVAVVPKSPSYEYWEEEGW